LASWVRAQTDDLLDRELVEHVWGLLEQEARSAEQEGLGYQPRLTLAALFWNWVGKPFIGALAAVYGFAAVVAATDWLASFASLAVALVVGLVARRAEVFRPFAYGWLVAAAAIAVAVLAATLGSALT
jgi:hypothetical protein